MEIPRIHHVVLAEVQVIAGIGFIYASRETLFCIIEMNSAEKPADIWKTAVR